AQRLPFSHVPEMGCDNRSNRSTVSCGVGVTTDVLVDRTSIHTCPAANAVKALTLFWICEYVRPAIVEQDHVHILRTIDFSFLPWTCNDCVVNSHALTGSKS